MLHAKMNREYKQTVQLVWIQVDNQTILQMCVGLLALFSRLQWLRPQQYPVITLASNVVSWIGRVFHLIISLAVKHLDSSMSNSTESLPGKQKFMHLNEFMRYPFLLLPVIMFLFSIHFNLTQIPSFPFQDTSTYLAVKEETCGALKHGF